MFIEFRDMEDLPVVVNLQRVMWAEPYLDNEVDVKGYTKLYMNVANNSGQPYELDVDVPFDEFKKRVLNLGENDEKASKQD